MKPTVVGLLLLAACPPVLAKKPPAAPPSKEVRALSSQTLPSSYAETGVIVRFSDALAHVWETHPDVRQAQQSLQASGFDVTAAYTGFLPYAQVDLGKSSRSDNYIARLVQPIFSGGSTVAAVDGAKAAERQALAELGRTRLQLALRLNDAWFSWVAAREQDQLYRTYIIDLESLRGVIQRRADEGAAPQSDVINALTRVRQAQAQAEANRAVLGATQAQLVALLGTRSLGEATWPDQSQSLDDKQVKNAWEHAREQHPVIQVALANFDRQDAERRVNRGRLFPELAIRHVKPFGDEAKVTEPVTELFVQYQTDSGFRALQGLRAGSSRTEGARASFDNARRETFAAINQATAERQAAKLQLGYQQEAAQAARDLIDSFVRQFEVGRKTWVEVLNAQREAQDTRLQSVQQRRAYWVADRRVALQGIYWDVLLRELDGQGSGALK